MTQAHERHLTTTTQERPREIIDRRRGLRRGALTQLMSPGDLGARLKPFISLGLLDTTGASISGFGAHPHSGIVTVTNLFEGKVWYEDTTGASGVLLEDGVEWFKAAHGAWHSGGPVEPGPTRGFQLWIALPPEHELGAVESIYQAPEDVRKDGPAMVLLGSHGGVSSPLNAPSSMNYLAVKLKAGESWRYDPPADHTIGWVAVASGRVSTPEPVEAVEIAVFEPSSAPITFVAETDAEFVLGSSVPHSHDLVMGNYSVHTSRDALKAGERRIQEIGARFRR